MKPLRVAALLAPLLAAAAADASPLEGVGRISVQPGWRLTPNDTFYASALAAGFPRERTSIGGPLVVGAFGYGATDWIEVAIDLFAGAEQLTLTGRPLMTTLTYGGMGGVRLHLELGPFAFARSWEASLGLHAGPTLVAVLSKGEPSMETLVTGYMGSLSLSARLSDQWGMALEYRLLVARGLVENVGTANAGGSWLAVGLTYYFPPQPKGPSFRW